MSELLTLRFRLVYLHVFTTNPMKRIKQFFVTYSKTKTFIHISYFNHINFSISYILQLSKSCMYMLVLLMLI